MTAFENARPWLEISASKLDMKKYIAGRVELEIRLQRHAQAEPTLLEEIETKIIDLAQGMWESSEKHPPLYANAPRFLAARLHLDILAKKQTRKAIRTALQELPKSINEIYDSIMDRIEAQDEEDAQLAMRALTCEFIAMPIVWRYVPEVYTGIFS